MTKKNILSLAFAAAFPAAAVTLNPDGTGQALIYPYYTAQSTGSDAFNTYISVVNHTSDAKAVRLRFREGRMGKSALDMNLYLSPNDVWTGAVVPFSTGTRLISTDVSCTEPRFAIEFAPGGAPFIDFRNDAFSGSNDDGAGTGLDRTREGFVEIIEMATLSGASAAAVTHNSAGVPSNCAALGPAPLVGTPTGGHSGTLTLINVANGIDFGVNAEALDDLAQHAFFRPATDPYPDFNAAEIDAVSVVTSQGNTYRSVWNRPVDAVSAVLMRTRAMTEYVLDANTASLTDVVMTFPTRQFYVTRTAATAPFTASGRWASNCAASLTGNRFGEPLAMALFNREERATTSSSGVDFPELPAPPAPAACASASVSTVRNASLAHMPRDVGTTPVLGSVTGGLGEGSIAAGPAIFVTASTGFTNGWLDFRVPSTATLRSTSQSSRRDNVSDTRFVGAHTYSGLPFVGFSVRIFRNGTLRCDAGSCQGNYGGAFPFKYGRNITPP